MIESGPQNKLIFEGVDIFNVNFSSSRPFKNEVEVQSFVDPKVFFPKDQTNVFKIIIELKLSAKDYFELAILAVGNFQLSGEVDDNTRDQYASTNAVGITFPYLRSFVSSFTSNLGDACPPITLPPRFFKGQLIHVPEEEVTGESTLSSKLGG